MDDEQQRRDEGGDGVNQQNRPAIESLDDYIRRYGLANANNEDDRGGEFNGLNRLEAIERVRAEEAFLDEVIEKHALEDDHPSTHASDEGSSDDEGVIAVLLANKSSHPVPVRPLVAYCETAKRMVSSRERFGVRDNDGDEDAKSSANDDDCAGSGSSGGGGSDAATIMKLDLVEFDSEAVLSFMGVLISLHERQQQEGTSDSSPDHPPSPSRKRRMSEDADEHTNVHVTALVVDASMIPEQQLVECLRISHYLQCRPILEVLCSILEASIDSRNCMSVCSLADALNLKSLFEASVNHVIERLDAFQGNAATSDDDNDGDGKEETKRASTSSSSDGDENDNQEEIWSSLPYELRSRVLTMRNVMRSSVIGRGSRVSGTFFASGSEFLAIFRETIRDQKERLAEAKERSDEVIRERSEEWVVLCQRRPGSWFDKSAEAMTQFVYGADVAYALEKIEKQSRRLQTLQSFYEEQKTIFNGTDFGGSEIIL